MPVDSHKAWGTARIGIQTSSLAPYVLQQDHSTLAKQQTCNSAREKITCGEVVWFIPSHSVIKEALETKRCHYCIRKGCKS